MAKVVIAGRADCPYFAKVELIGDKLLKNLPDFNLHKIVKTDTDWEPWLSETCNERGWTHGKSPIVWRELIDRGGKGVLIGGANEFQEYVMGYYGIQSDMTSDDMTKVADENKVTKSDVDVEMSSYKAQSQPLQVCITNASSPVCYNIIDMIGSGEVFGSTTEMAIRLYDTEDKAEYLAGVEMEAHDLAYGLLRNVNVYSDATKAFTDCSVVVLLDEVEKQEEESKEDWLKRNAEVFTNYGRIISEVAAQNAKVLLAGQGPLNFNTYMMLKNAPNISRQNIAGVSRMVENHAKSVVGNRLAVNTAGVVDLVVWGNVNSKTFIDITKTRVHGYDGAIWGPPSFSVSAQEMIHDDKWLQKEFLELVATRRHTVESALGHPASMAQAMAIATTLNHWTNGSPKGQIFSLAVCSEGWYDVPEGLVFSFPVTMHPKGYYSLVQEIDLTPETKTTLKAIVEDLKKEIEVMYPPPCPTPPEQPTEEQEQNNNNQEEGAQTTQQEGGEQNSQEGGEQTSQEEQNTTDENNTVNKQEDTLQEGETENSQEAEAEKEEEDGEPAT